MVESRWRAERGPLATRMRPESFDQILGQDHIVGPGRLLRRAVESDRLTSAIFWGPPGSGKTTLASVIARHTRSHFEQASAVLVGVADIRRVVAAARERIRMHGQGTVLFLDEIHRFNKGQQDALLPHVEDGTMILLGATTENPYFTINSALLSRARVFRLKAMEEQQLVDLLRRAASDPERGLGDLQLSLDEDAVWHWARMAEGDARTALNALELAALTTEPNADGIRQITLAIAAESMQQKAVVYDRTGDGHYDVISAFIKSIRGSDPDAGLYWLAVMLEAGEDPRFVARRLMILAAEDVGLADPQALVLAVAAAECLEMVGLPEARIALAEIVVYLALAPKSNTTYAALQRAEEEVRSGPRGEVPLHLRNPVHPGLAGLGHGRGYIYPHDTGGYASQAYTPETIEGAYYRPQPTGHELGLVRDWLQRVQSHNPCGDPPRSGDKEDGQ